MTAHALYHAFMPAQVISGLMVVREALSAAGRINRLYVAKESRARGVDAVVSAARDTGVPVDYVPQAKLNNLTSTRDHQGIAAAISPIEYARLDDCLAASPATALWVALDQVQHPKNLGLLIRTAVGAGASALLLSARGGALLDTGIVRASAGTIMHLPVIRCENLPRAFGTMKLAGFWLYGLESDGVQSVFDVQWAARSGIVLGNESKGIRPAVRKSVDLTVRIPLARRLNSLNVAVAAGVAVFEAGRRLGTLG
jgi:23S rRNA (guanosine2251-2'-O)-methyltransferase